MAEKATATKSKNMFLKFLPKAASAPFSPNKDKRSSQKSHLGKSIIPADALRSKSKNSSFGFREPTSPQVSCMGTLKHKKKLCSMLSSKNYVLPPLDHLNLMVKNHNNSKVAQSDLEGDVKKKKKPLAIKNMFSRVPSAPRKSDAVSKTTDHVSDHRPSSSSSLSQMRRFSSSRTSLNNFDWTATQIAPVDNEGEKVKISTCVPKVILECKEVNLEPRKDVNLWKRRPMAQPSPLQIQT
ncbi:hypothetical protein POM88_012006 [Heracleum sosnowskyi]|uniref:Uncharacterized protein n=1 Tax=Heracleum sosnowskyi TaxID=360622 RepID=A0AAD8IZH1_9APIA|nr:hypothetical protein POM88_012006 [Heracleum sosnowskyi]